MANVGYATLQIIPSAKGFTTALQSEVAPGMAAAGSASSKKFGSSFIGGLKSIAGPLAAVAGTAAIGNFLKGAVTGASDLNETLTKTQAIFGAATKEVVKFAEDSKRNILLTKQEALDASATFGIFGKSAGLTGKDLSGFSTKLTGLASDLSSFFNTSTDDAIVALGAALRGESEPIRRYGVLLDDASLRAEALKQGLVKTTKQALTPQQRVLAAQALILKQTSDAQGDAARTADGLANQQRILRKNFQDIKVEVGTALLPVVNGLVHALNAGIKPAFEAVKQAISPVINAFKGLGSEGGKANGMAAQLQKTFAAIQAFLAPVTATLKQIGEQVFARLSVGFSQISDIVQNDFLPAIQAILPVITPVAQFILKFIGGALLGALNGALNVIKGVLKVISGIFNVFAGIFTGDWKKLWNGLKQIVSGLWDAIKGVIEVALNVGVLKIFRTGGQLILNIGKTIFTALKEIFEQGLSLIIKTLLAYPKAVLNIFASGKTLLLNAGKDLISGFINGIKAMGGKIIETIKATITDALPGFVKKALGIASPSKVFKEIGKNVGLGFIKGVQGTQDKIRDTFTKLAELVKKTGNKALISAVADAQKKILKLSVSRDALREAYSTAKDSLKELQNQAADLAASVSDAIQATGNVTNRTTFAGIVSDLTNSVTQAKEFYGVIKDLKAAGLNETALKQLIDAGPAEALASAKAILAGGGLGIEAINTLQAELKKQGDSLGGLLSDTLYGKSIKDAKDKVSDIAKDLTEVENQIVSVAAALAREIAKIGKIPVPAWLENLAAFTDNTVPDAVTRAEGVARSLAYSPKANKTSLENTDGPGITIYNYNPVAEATSVTVSNTLTRLALIGGGR